MAKTDPTETFEVVSGPRDAPDGIVIGQSATATVGFFGATPVAQQADANQAAAGTTGATTTSPWGFTTSTQANALINLVDEMRTALVNLGLMKGAA